MRPSSNAIRIAASVSIAAILFLELYLTLQESSFDIRRAVSVHFGTARPPPPDAAAESVADSREPNVTQLAKAAPFVGAILDSEDTSFPRLECPLPDTSRYGYLRQQTTDRRQEGDRGKYADDDRPTYFFALDLHQCAPLLPRLLGSVVEAVRLLGPSNCALSIVEGRSDDGTFEILHALRKDLDHLGLRYILTSSDVAPVGDKDTDRIAALAELRNLALAPLVRQPDAYAADATVVFLNDVALCADDILELVHQRRVQHADMTCAMDWTYVGPDPTFYDVWIARGMNGDSFFEIPADANWNSAWNLFWNDADTRQRYDAGRPFQVFACWNGATAFTTRPLVEGKIRFRSHYPEECLQGEPRIFCKEMWYHGYGKIAVVPSVNVEYSDEAATKIKALKGYVSKFTATENDGIPVHIDWRLDPPERVKCMTNYENQPFLPWNESLADHAQPP